jgi:hypothetical protein
MKNLHLSKWAVFIGFALVIGLVLSLLILEARSTEEETESIDQIATEAVSGESLDEAFTSDLVEKIRRAEEERSLSPLSTAALRALQRESDEDGRPFVWIACGSLFGVDEKGVVLSVSAEMTDAPVLTGGGLKYNPKSKRVDGVLFREAVEFIRLLSKRNTMLGRQLSEVQCHPEVGLVAYFSQNQPVFIGRGKLQQKVRKLDVFYEQLGASDLAAQIRCIDARLDGQLVLKKKS